MTRERIFDMEIKYVSLFSRKEKIKSGFIFKDDQQKDKYFHNFLMIYQDNFDTNEIKLYEKEKQTDGFVIYRFEEINHLDLTWLSEYHKETYGYFFSAINDLSITPNANCHIEMVDPTIDDIFFDFMYQEDLEYGISYAKNNIIRQKEVMIKNREQYVYIKLIVDGKIIGHLNAFVSHEMAKIDEFYVKNEYQRRGYGTAMMDYMIKLLKKREVKEVYLVTDLGDTAKDLYVKYGFILKGQFEQYKKSFPVIISVEK